MRHVWGREDIHQGFVWGNVMEIDHLDDLGVAGRIMFKWTLKKRREGADWIQLARDRGKWRAVVITVMNIRVLKTLGNLLTR